MVDDNFFLRGILSSPQDVALRQAYSDWLDERGDPRGEFLRIQPALQRFPVFKSVLRFVPEVGRSRQEWQSQKSMRSRFETIKVTIDPAWLTFMNTYGDRYRPFYFVCGSNGGIAIQPTELAFTNHIGARGALVFFKGQFRDGDCWDPELMTDLRILSHVALDDCRWPKDSGEYPVCPFVCQIRTGGEEIDADDIVTALNAQNYDYEFIAPPEASRTYFADFCGASENQPRRGNYSWDGLGPLKRHVVDEHLWHLRLRRDIVRDYRPSRYSILFVVGLSPTRKRLIGVVTHQIENEQPDWRRG